MKLMKKLLAILLCVLTAASLAACGSKSATSGSAGGTTETEQIADPFTNCDTLAEAEKISGLTLSVPDAITDTFQKCTYRALENQMIELIYTDGTEDDEIRIRKGTGTDDISGDYNTYAETRDVTVGKNTVTFKGSDGKVSLAVWTANGQAYSVAAVVGGAGISEDEMTQILGKIDADGTMGEQIANPFVDCATMQEAAKLAGFEMTVPETVEGFSDPVIQAIADAMIQVSFTDGKDSLLLRKGAGTDDISGDYNAYEQTKTLTVGGQSVTVKGNGGTVSVAVWTNGGYTYAIDAEGAGISEALVQTLVASIG